MDDIGLRVDGTALMPTDRTDENPGWISKEPYYDDWYTVSQFFSYAGCTCPDIPFMIP